MKQQTQQSKKALAKTQAGAAEDAVRKMAAGQGREQDAVAEERHQKIAEVAYHIAEQRGFQGDMAMADWLQAEAEVNARFSARH